MAVFPGDTRPLWLGKSPASPLAPLGSDLEVDVAIVGMGISGLTAALRLTRAGKRVAVVDSHGVALGETGRTTAHVTEVLDTRYHQIEKDFGREGALCAAESSRWAIAEIESTLRTLDIACEFSRVPAFLYADAGQDDQELDAELKSATDAGLRATLTQEVPLPFAVKRALRVEQQAQLDVYRYLSGIAGWLQAQGTLLFGGTHVNKVQDGEPCVLSTSAGFTIRARDVFVATNTPVNDRFFFHTMAFPYRTYAVASRVGRLPPPGLYWDLADPYHYTRTQEMPDGNYLIVGGEDHKVGKAEDTRVPFQHLEAYARERFGMDSVEYYWSGQIIEPADGLPYIGLNPLGSHVYVATGYSGNGVTLGTVAGAIVSDIVLGRENAFAPLYRSTRVKPLASAKEFLVENIDFPTHLIADRLKPADAKSFREVQPGEGRLISIEGHSIAVYREPGGKCHALSAVCTHLGCHVRFNTAERSWDCPCHGGRFGVRGEVLNGPPCHPLKPLPQLLPNEERAP